MNDSENSRSDSPAPLTAPQVLDYLRDHPQFLQEHPEILLQLAPPEQQLEGNIEDFQHALLQRLQREIRHLKENYKGLIHTSRDNMSTQSQVHYAVLELLKVQDLQTLLQTLTQDLQQRFDVDMVRLLIESPMASAYDVPHSQPQLSGLRYAQPGMAEALLGPDTDCLLISDIHAPEAAAIQPLFSDCEGIVASCAVLKLELPRHARQALLLFGVRHKNHFHPQMGRDMLAFLGKVIAQKLEDCLIREGTDHAL